MRIKVALSIVLVSLLLVTPVGAQGIPSSPQSTDIFTSISENFNSMVAAWSDAVNRFTSSFTGTPSRTPTYNNVGQNSPSQTVPTRAPLAPQEPDAVLQDEVSIAQFIQPSIQAIATQNTVNSNLIRNNSFEVDTNGAPRMWRYQHNSATDNTVRSIESIRSGIYGLKFKGGAAGTLGLSQPETKTVPGRPYTLSMYIKPVNTSAGTLKFGFWDEYSNKYGTMKTVSFKGTKEWQRVSMTVNTPGIITNDKNWFPMIEVTGLTAGNFYIDDVLLEEGTVLSPFNSASAKNGTSATELGGGSILFTVDGDLYPALTGQGSLGFDGNRFYNAWLSNDANVARDVNAGGDLVVNGGDIGSDENLSLRATGYVRVGDTGTPGVATGDDALYVEGAIEGDSTLSLAGAATFDSDLTLAGDLAVNGGDLTSTATTFNLLNATVTTLNIGGAGTTIAVGSGLGTTVLSNNLTVNMVDNNTNALDIQESANNYINVNTTNAGENISFGNATTDPSFNFLGDGAVAIAGAEGATKLTLTAGDQVISDGSLAVTDDDNAASFSTTNNTASTIGAGVAGGVNVLASTSLTTGDLLELQLTEGTLAGGTYLNAWDVTGGASVFSIGEDGLTTIAGAGDGTDALVLTTGDILVSNGDLDVAGGDFNVTLDAGDGANIAKGAAPTVDVFTINGGTSATTGVDNLQLTFSADNASGNVVDITPSYAGGATDTLTFNVVDLDAFAPTNDAGTDTVRGLNIGALTDPGATITSTAINIGAGWDTGISLGANSIVGTTGIIDYSLFDVAATGAITVINNADVAGLTIAPTVATTTAIDLTDTDIATALSVGANDIVGTTGNIDYTNFDVNGTTGKTDWILGAAGQLTIDAATTDNTTTDGVIKVTQDSTANGIGLNIESEVIDDNAIDTQAGVLVTMTNSADDSDVVYGLQVAELGGTASGGNEYAIYQAGTAWDYGLYVTDDAYFGDNVSVTDDLSVEGILDMGTLDSMADNDLTPSVAGSAMFSGDANADTVHAFDDDVAGQVWVIKHTTGTTFDCDNNFDPGGGVGADELQCGTTDIVTAAGDSTIWYSDGTQAFLINWEKESVAQTGVDVAEWMKSTQSLSAGTVVVAHPSEKETVVRSEQESDSRVIGIVSDVGGVLSDIRPGLLLGDKSRGNTPVALAGRVMAKFDGRNGSTQPGDALTSAPDGRLMKALKAGPTVGKALGSEENGLVLVLVNIGWFDPSEVSLAQLDAVSERIALLEALSKPAGEVLGATTTTDADASASTPADTTDVQATATATEPELGVQETASSLLVDNRLTTTELSVTKLAVFSGDIKVTGLAEVASLTVSGGAKVGGTLEIGGAVVIAATAAEDLKAGDAVRVSSANEVRKADSTDAARALVLGLATGDVKAGDLVKVAVGGRVGGYENLAVGKAYFLGTNGKLVTGAPENAVRLVQVGLAMSETDMVVQITTEAKTVEKVVEVAAPVSTATVAGTSEPTPEPTAAPAAEVVVEPTPTVEPTPEPTETPPAEQDLAPQGTPTPTP